MDEAKFTFSLKLGDGSLTVRADTKAELDQLTEQANEFLREQENGRGTTGVKPAGMPTPPVNAVQDMVDKTKARQAEVDAKIAQEKVTQHLGPGQEAASEAVLKKAAKKKGVSIEDLGLISHEEAMKILRGGE